MHDDDTLAPRFDPDASLGIRLRTCFLLVARLDDGSWVWLPRVDVVEQFTPDDIVTSGTWEPLSRRRSVA